jgi:hypothetical protein
MIVYNVENKKYEDLIIDQISDEQQKFIIPFSSLFKKKKSKDIYTGKEKMPFKDRHPTYQALLKLEFEEAIKAWITSNS